MQCYSALVSLTTTSTAHSIVAGDAFPGSEGRLRALDPSTGQPLDPWFTALSTGQLTAATRAAQEAFTTYRDTTPAQRAAFLEGIAQQIEALGDELLERAAAESGLPLARVTGERGRTTGQLRLFADVARRGDHLGVRIDPALPQREPAPRPDLRMRQVPLGPVAVFGASNFPLAFSTAGGDTASALAAGCPVVVKAHPAHPGTAQLVGQAITHAARRTGMPAGVFSLVHGVGTDLGQALVTDPRIAAVGFTGSRAGGLALVAAAASRPRPIPVYAEMSSVNPVVLLEGSLSDPDALAASYLGSLTLGSGQFCTNPGLVFVPTSDAGDAFVAAVSRNGAATRGQTMLTPGIRQAYDAGASARSTDSRLTIVATGDPGDGPNAPAPQVVSAPLRAVADDPELQGEVFGASGVVVRYDDLEALLSALGGLEGQLTATVHADTSSPADVAAAARLLPVLEGVAGRILFGGWPTGVEVSHAMVHGGPFPATSDGRSSSVGTLAIERWQRPVCYQDVPDGLLPPAVQDDNPWELVRRLDGRLLLPGTT